MKQVIRIASGDGHVFDAWRADPSQKQKGGIVVLHAVYGLTDHIGDVCARWAEAGYTAIAPALFDRTGFHGTHPYSRQGADAGIRSFSALTQDDVFQDVEACAAILRSIGPIAISGFCTGGTWAWRSAAVLPFDAQLNFYGSHVPAHLGSAPLCPTLMHYGDMDTIVPPDQVAHIQAAHPDVRIEIYPGAGHAFVNPAQDGFNAGAADRAFARSIAFLDSCFGP